MKTVLTCLFNYILIFTNLARNRSGDKHLTQIWDKHLTQMFIRYKIKLNYDNFDKETEKNLVKLG